MRSEIAQKTVLPPNLPPSLEPSHRPSGATQEAPLVQNSNLPITSSKPPERWGYLTRMLGFSGDDPSNQMELDPKSRP